MLKISGKNRGCLIVLNIPQLREKINKTCANRPVSCVNGEVRTEFGSLKEPAYRCAAALGRRACPLSLAPLASSPFGSNGDDRRQRRKQGGAVGAAASRMRATAKQTLGAATRAVARRRRDGEVLSWAGARQLQLSMQTKNHLNLKDPSGFLLMELLSRFELETSSLPRMRSTN